MDVYNIGNSTWSSDEHIYRNGPKYVKQLLYISSHSPVTPLLNFPQSAPVTSYGIPYNWMVKWKKRQLMFGLQTVMHKHHAEMDKGSTAVSL